MSDDIFVKALTPDEWQIFRTVRLTALKEHPGVFLRSYDEQVKISESGWRELLNGGGKCVFGLFSKKH